MNLVDLPPVAQARMQAKWWRPVSDAFSVGAGAFGRAVEDASNLIKLNPHELNYALQVQIFYADRCLKRNETKIGKVLNALMKSDIGYCEFAARHANQVLALAGFDAIQHRSANGRRLVRIDVAKAALEELRRVYA